jgi:branched-chain amino acid transport system permease protein
MQLILDVIISGLIIGAIYSLIAAGLNLQYGVARILNVAHGEFVMVGAFWAYCMHTIFRFDPLVSLAMFSPVTLLIGYLLYKSLFQYVKKSAETIEMFEGNSMLVSFGLLYVIQNLALLWWGTSRKAYTYFSFPLDFLGVTFEANRVLALLIGAGLMGGLYLFLKHTRLGKAIRAASESTTVAELSGINIHRVLGLCFGLGTMLACIAGGLISMMNEITASMGFPYLIIALVVVVLGGLGNILGSFLGGLLLGLVTTIVMYWEPELTLIASYLIFTLVLLIRPQGIFGR